MKKAIGRSEYKMTNPIIKNLIFVDCEGHGPGSPGMKQFNRKHDNIFWYTKSDKWIFNGDDVRMPSEVHAGGFGVGMC